MIQTSMREETEQKIVFKSSAIENEVQFSLLSRKNSVALGASSNQRIREDQFCL